MALVANHGNWRAISGRHRRHVVLSSVRRFSAAAAAALASERSARQRAGSARADRHVERWFAAARTRNGASGPQRFCGAGRVCWGRAQRFEPSGAARLACLGPAARPIGDSRRRVTPGAGSRKKAAAAGQLRNRRPLGQVAARTKMSAAQKCAKGRARRAECAMPVKGEQSGCFSDRVQGGQFKVKGR